MGRLAALAQGLAPWRPFSDPATTKQSLILRTRTSLPSYDSESMKSAHALLIDVYEYRIQGTYH
jgi:hypothetical protein